MKDIITRLLEAVRGRGETLDPHAILGMEGLAARNEARLAQIKDEMGEKYILHPNNKKSRLDEPRPV